jgi:hypothetical protein
MRTFAVDRKNFNLLGEIIDKNDNFVDEGLIIIESVDYKSAKDLLDNLEANTYPEKSIDIKDLLSILNNMEREHGSLNISPENLKFLIKKNLGENIK